MELKNNWCCSLRNLKINDDGSVGTLSELDADWSVITKYRARGIFDLMDINKLSLSVPATVGRLLRCFAEADQLLTSDINPSDNNNVHLSCAYQRPERSHDTY